MPFVTVLLTRRMGPGPRLPVAALPVAAVAFTAVPPVRLPFSSTCTDSEQLHVQPLRYPALAHEFAVVQAHPGQAR